MPTQVHLPDGSIGEFPDGMSEDQITAVLKKQYPPEAPARGPVTKAVDAIGRGLLNTGLSAIEGISGGTLDPNNIDPATGKMRMAPIPLVEKGRAWVNEHFPEPKADSKAGEYAYKGLEGGAAALGSPSALGGAVRTGVGGVLSGLGGVAGKDLLGPGIGELVGNVVGGVVGGAAGVKVRNVDDLAREAMVGVDPTHLSQAKAMMADALAKKVPINASQAMPKATNIDDMVSNLAQSRYGENTIKQLRDQPELLKLQGQVAVGSLPGQVRTQQSIANDAQAAATGAITDVKKARTAITQPIYTSAPDLPVRDATSMADNVKQLYSQPGMPADVKAAAQTMEEGIRGSTNPQDISTHIRDFTQKIAGDRLTPLDPYTKGVMEHIAGQVKNDLAAKSGMTALGNTLYSDISANHVDPLKKSVVGRIAGLTGDQADREATKGKLYSVFDAGTQPNSKRSEILDVEKTFRSQDPAVFTDGVKSYLSDKLTKILPTEGERVSPTFAQDVKNALSPNPAKAQGFNDMLAGVARSNGLPEKDLVDGFNNFIKLSTLAVNRPAQVSGLPRQEMEAMAGSSVAATAAKSFGFTPFHQMGKKIEMALSADAYKTMDKLLTTPEGLDTLQKLAKNSVMSSQARNAIGAFYGAIGSNDPITEK